MTDGTMCKFLRPIFFRFAMQFTVLSGGPKLIKCTEDEDFMSAFDSMLSETIQQRFQESAKIPQADIAIPMNLKGQKCATKREFENCGLMVVPILGHVT